MDKENIDLKIILSFTNQYQNLYEKGDITEDQLNSVIELLDNYQNYSPEDFKKTVQTIFE